MHHLHGGAFLLPKKSLPADAYVKFKQVVEGVGLGVEFLLEKKEKECCPIKFHNLMNKGVPNDVGRR
mgnify:CR=1 FL=1